jgi:hypothetical protein
MQVAYDRIRSLIVAVHGREPATDPEWESYIAFIASHVANFPSPRLLVVTAGGAPTPLQRRQLMQATSTAMPDVRAAILTSSTFVRGIVTAMSILEPQYRAFSPDSMEDALRYLQLPVGHVNEVNAIVARLQARL